MHQQKEYNLKAKEQCRYLPFHIQFMMFTQPQNVRSFYTFAPRTPHYYIYLFKLFLNLLNIDEISSNSLIKSNTAPLMKI